METMTKMTMITTTLILAVFRVSYLQTQRWQNWKWTKSFERPFSLKQIGMSSSRQVLGKVLILGSQPLQPVAGIKPELSSWYGEHILAQVSGSFFAFYCIVRILNSSSNYLSTNCFYANFKFSQAKARNNFVAPWSLPDLASGQTWVSRVRFPPSERGQPWRSCTPMARRSGCKPVLKVIKNILYLRAVQLSIDLTFEAFESK